MQTKISKWGNSLGVRLPIKTIKRVGISVGDLLDIDVIENKIILNSSKNHSKKIPLSKILKGFNSKNHAEMFTDNPVGEEIW